jgi:hypothetical protein
MAHRTSHAASERVENIRFNQHQIERELQPGGEGPPGPTDASDTLVAGFDDPATVIAAVLRAAPDRAVVYPSERYYYFEFDLGVRRVGGNLRFTDAERGVVHVGYFDRLDQSDMRSATFGERDGLECEEIGAGVYRVEFRGVERRFRLAAEYLDARPPALAPGERVISGVLDESGWTLALIWSESERGFRFVLAADAVAPEPLLPIPGTDERLMVGRESRFVFWRDALDRVVLVGVRSEHVRANNRYDGPFDQVPPQLAIGPLLEAAYPYVNDRGGIDAHGNFVRLEGHRVAISPYQVYRTLGEFTAVVRAMVDGGRADEIASVLTYERKRELSSGPAPDVNGADEEGGAIDDSSSVTLGRLLAPPRGAHRLWMSQGWPGNHHAMTSRLWPVDHRREASSTRAPNSVPATWRTPGAGPATPPPADAGRRPSADR